MTLLTLKISSLLLILLVSLLAGIYPFYKKARTRQVLDLPIAEALASGIFLGAGLLHMLADSAQDFIGLGYHYPIPFLLAGGMFLFLLWLEHMGREVQEHKGGNRASFAVLAVLMLSIHSLLEGTALGLGGTISSFLVIFFAIIAHKWAAAFALATQINKSSLNAQVGMGLFLIFALMTPFGILLGDFIVTDLKTHLLVEPIFSALAGGTFLYLGTLHGLSRSFMINKCCNLHHFAFVIVGFSLMAIVAIWT